MTLPRWAAWSLITLCIAACSGPDNSGRDGDAALTADNICNMRVERCNARDDDCDGIIDERADTSCALAHAASRCVSGSCVIDRCSEGYVNCNDITSDGCEAMLECGEETAAPAQSMTPNMPNAGLDASSPSVATGEAPQAGQAGQMSSPEPDDADGGKLPGPQEDMDASGPEADAGASCEPERCDGQDNDCDVQVDEGACSCADGAPTGQGPECDSCVCDACPEALSACTGTEDAEWNTLCGEILLCFGNSVQAGLCTGDDSDCYQNGDGPCASEFRSAFSLGWVCSADPVRSPCGALTRIRLECFRNQCAAVCKA